MPRLSPVAMRPGYTRDIAAYRLGTLTGHGHALGLGKRWYRQKLRTRSAPSYYALHRRRIRLDIQCRRAGMTQLRPGVWCDNVANVMYAGYGACDWGR